MMLAPPSIQNTDVPSATIITVWKGVVVAMTSLAVVSQTPPTQRPLQVAPQPPQLARSPWGSTQTPLQSIIPLSHSGTHVPALHPMSPPSGGVWHCVQVGPQQLGSLAMSKHLPLTAV